MIQNHSNDCFILNKKELPELIKNTNEIKLFNIIINDYFEKLNYFNKKEIK